MNAHTTVPALHEINVEQLLIGAVMAQPSAYWKVNEIVATDDFYDPFHRSLWRAIGKQVENDRPVDVGALSALLKPVIADLTAKDFDAQEYLFGLAAHGAAHADVRGWAKIVSDLAQRRRIVAAASEAIDAAYYDRETAPDSLADLAGESIYEAAHRNEAGRGTENLVDVIRRAADMAEVSRKNPDRARVTLGLPSLDRALGGMFPRDLHVLAAASSMGKSGLIGQIALAASRSGAVPLVFSIEMASEEFATRFLAQDAGVPANRIAEGRISVSDMERIAEATQNYSEDKFFLDGSTNLTIAQMRARAQAVRRRHGRVDVIIADHLRLIRAADMRAPEHERLDQITKDAKALGKDMDAAVLLIAPVNRELWKRDSHRPVISDIYGASAIEYNADHIWFLHREEFYLERAKPDTSNVNAYNDWQEKMERVKGQAEVFGAKRRGGPLGSAMLRFNAPLVRFEEIDNQQPTAQEMMF
jgi:replicative DNA helicase